MTATIKTTISIQKTIFDEAEILARQLHIPPDRLFEIAIENFMKDSETQATALPTTGEQRAINQGDIYWIQPEKSGPEKSGKAEESGKVELGYYTHPYVVIQDNVFNYSRISSVVVCALTSNLKEANAPGNVLLELGEADLPKHSVVVVSKVSSVAKSQLGEYIGTLAEERVSQILAGMRFLHLSFFAR